MSDVITIKIDADSASAQAAISATGETTRSLGRELDNAGASGRKAGKAIKDGMDEAGYSMQEARHAAMLLGEETGVRVPRALANILAKSETLGPILAGAFSIVAIGAFAELAEKAGEKLSQWITDTFIMTDADKDLNNTLAATNKSIEERNKKIVSLQHEMELIGKTESEKAALKLKWDTSATAQDAAKIKQQIDSVNEEAKNKAEEGTGFFKGLADAALSTFNVGPIFLERSLKDIDALHSKAAALQGDLQSQEKLADAESKKDSADLTQAEINDRYKSARERLKIETEIGKGIAEMNKEHEKEIAETSKLMEFRLKTQLESELKVAEATIKADEAQLQLNATIAKAAAERQADVVAQDKASGNIKKEQADTKTLIQLLDQQKAAELAVVDAKIAGAGQGMQTAFDTGGTDTADFQESLAKYREYQAQRVQITAEADKKIDAANDQTLKQDQKSLNEYLGKFNQEFASSFAQVATGHETLAKAASKMYEQMTTQLLKNLAIAAMGELEGLALHKSVAAQKQFTDAKTAASGAYSALSGVPYIGPIIAPIAAAGAFAAVMAFDDGGMVPVTQMALVHSGEAVLTPSQTDNLKSAADNMGGGDTHNYGDTHVHAMDSSSFQSFLKKNPGALSAGISHAVRGGHLDAASLVRGK